MAEAVGFLQVLGGKEEGDAVAVQLLDVAPDLVARDGVEAGGWFIEKDDSGLMDEGAGEVQSPFHAAGVALHGAVGGIGEADDFEKVVDAAAGLARRDAEEAGLEGELLSAGLEVIQADFLEGDADELADAVGVGEDIDAADAGGAGGRPQEGGEHADGGGLPGAVLAEEAEDLSLGDVEVDAIDGADIGREVLDETVCGNGGHGRSRARRGAGKRVWGHGRAWRQVAGRCGRGDCCGIYILGTSARRFKAMEAMRTRGVWHGKFLLTTVRCANHYN